MRQRGFRPVPFFGSLILVLGVLLSMGVLYAQAPEITAVYGPSGPVRLMDGTTLTAVVSAGGDPRPIEYHWSIESETYAQGTGAPVTDRHLAELTPNPIVESEARLRLWWDEARSSTVFNEVAAEALIPGDVVVRLDVNFEGSAQTASRSLHITVSQVNHPPQVQFCSGGGYLESTPVDRVPGGQAGALSVNCSVDPDGTGISAAWGLGSKRGAGRYSGIFVLYQSDTPTVSFTIPQIFGGPIDQDVNVRLYDGLHERTATRTLYLSPTAPSNTHLPEITVPTSVTVQANESFQIVASASDADGDSIQVGWTFLGGAATTALNWVNAPATGSSIVSTLTHPGAPAGSVLQFRVAAWETANPSRMTTQTITVNVSGTLPPPSNGDTPTAEQYGQCTPDAYGPPSIVSGQYGGLSANAGETVGTWVILRDTTSVMDIFGNQLTGPAASQAAWDYSALQAVGASGFASVVLAAGNDPTSLEFRLQFEVPASLSQTVTADVFLTVPDQKGCTSRVTLPITLYPEGTSLLPALSISTFPDSVQVGEAFTVEAKVDNADAGTPYDFAWSMLPEDDSPILSDTAGADSVAHFVAPPLDGLTHGFVSVSVDVTEPCGTWSDSVDAVIALKPASLDFSQVAAGPFNAPGICDNCTIETVVALLNPAEGTESSQMQGDVASAVSDGSAAQGRLTFHEGLSESMVGPSVDGDGSLDDQGRYLFQIPEGEGREFRVYSDSLWVGWLSVESSRPLIGHLFYRYLDEQEHVVAEVPVLPVRGRSFTTVLSASAPAQVGLAVANLSDEEIHFEVIVDDGAATATRPIALGPKGQFAMILTEIFGRYSSALQFPPGFHGGTLSLRLTSGDGRLALTVIKLSEVSLPLAILPVAVDP